jgi:hypothetical protein
MSSARDERRRPDGAARPRGPEPDRPDPGAPKPDFFLALFWSGIREARIYRAYPDPDGVAFVYAGPAVAFLDPELARGGGHGDWKARAVQSLRTSLVSAGGALVLLVGVLVLIGGRILANQVAAGRPVFEGRPLPTDFIGMLIAFVAVFAVTVLVVLTTAVRRITRRVAALDALSAEQLRAEAETEKRSFRATADNVRDVRLDPGEQAGGGRPASAARLSLRHDPTGKWKLDLLTRADARAAARAFRRLLGKDEVAVNFPLREG